MASALLVLASLALLSALSSTSDARMTLVSAGANSKDLLRLRNGTTICTSDYATGVNVRCRGRRADTTSLFTKDGAFSTIGNYPPFYVAGDAEGNPKAWIDPPASVVIGCVTRPSLRRQVVSINFACGDSPPVDEPPLDSPPVSTRADRPVMYFAALGKPFTDGSSVRLSGGKFCPLDELSSRRYSIACVAPSGAAPGTFRISVNGVVVREKTDATVAFINGARKSRSDAPVPIRWRKSPSSYVVSCTFNNSPSARQFVRIDCGDQPSGSPVTEESPRKETPRRGPGQDGLESAGCIIINPKSAPLGKGWENVADGIQYLKDSKSKGITKSGVSQIRYSFSAPIKSRYGIVIEMTTGSRADFNDIWLRMTGGLLASRKSSTKQMKGWIKGYHNFATRAAFISTVDNDAHSIASGTILEKDGQYDLDIGGRSAQVIVHKIVMFPCAENRCKRANWQETQEICYPGST